VKVLLWLSHGDTCAEGDQLNEPAFKQTSNFHLRVEGATATVTGTTTNTGILYFNDQ